MSKKIKTLIVGLISVCMIICFSACSSTSFTNPGDSLGGGGTGTTPSDTDTSTLETTISDAVDTSDVSTLQSNTDSTSASTLDATSDALEITTGGDYVLSGTYASGIVITVGDSETTHLYLSGATISNDAGIAISNTNKKSTLIITLVENTTNSVSNSGEDVNAIHVKGNLVINGSGSLSVTSSAKSAIKVSKALKIVGGNITASASSHAITALSVIAQDCTIKVTAAGKDGINAECNDSTTEYTTTEGYIYLNNVTYTYTGEGDGIQADTFVLIESGTYNITTVGSFVAKTTANMTEYDLTDDDFDYVVSGSSYKKIASDATTSATRYALVQSCKGIKVGEIKYDSDSDDVDDVTVTDGDYTIVINGGTFNIDSTDDAIHCNCGNVLINDGTYTINTFDDGITSDELTQIKAGTIDIQSSYEGIEGARVEISGGTIDLIASDDGINAASDTSTDLHIIITGGEIYVNASGDGLDSNGSILISGGKVYVDGPTSGSDASLDANNGILINGGYVFAIGALGMVETPATNSEQYCVSFAASSSIASGTAISLTDEDGNVIFSFTTGKVCQSIIISCPELESGETHCIYGGSTKLTTFTVSSKITTVGTSTTAGGSSTPSQGGIRR